MTPKEKADELYSNYDNLLNKDFGNPIVFDNQIKQCALVAVDEILYVLNEIDSTEQWNASWFYNEVKLEIELL